MYREFCAIAEFTSATIYNICLGLVTLRRHYLWLVSVAYNKTDTFFWDQWIYEFTEDAPKFRRGIWFVRRKGILRYHLAPRKFVNVHFTNQDFKGIRKLLNLSTTIQQLVTNNFCRVLSTSTNNITTRIYLKWLKWLQHQCYRNSNFTRLFCYRGGHD